MPEPADEAEILREQLDYLIEHAAGNVPCGCGECQRYVRVRAALLEIFGEPARTRVLAMAPQLAKAA
jgi:hypothetical protein